MTAEKMFKELGYHIVSDDETLTRYDNDIGKTINFYKEKSGVAGVAKVDFAEVVSLYNLGPKPKIATPGIVSIQELKAINEKCKELGWLN